MTTYAAPVLKAVSLATGVTLPYAVQGDPAGIPVILLHGGTDSWHSYELLLPHLPPPIRAYALTQRGHGDADRPVSGYAPGDFAADLVAFMDALEIPSAVLVGHSLSTGIAARVAMDHPERVRGLVLIGAFRNWRHAPDFIAWIHEAIEPLTDPVDPAFAHEFQESTLAMPSRRRFWRPPSARASSSRRTAGVTRSGRSRRLTSNPGWTSCKRRRCSSGATTTPSSRVPPRSTWLRPSRMRR